MRLAFGAAALAVVGGLAACGGATAPMTQPSYVARYTVELTGRYRGPVHISYYDTTGKRPELITDGSSPTWTLEFAVGGVNDLALFVDTGSPKETELRCVIEVNGVVVAREEKVSQCATVFNLQQFTGPARTPA